MSAKYPGSLKLYGKRILDGSKTFAASGSSKSFWDYLFYPPPASFALGADASPVFTAKDVSPDFSGEVVT